MAEKQNAMFLLEITSVLKSFLPK